MEACPKTTTNLIGVYKMACNRSVRVDRSVLALGLAVGLSSLYGVVTSNNYAI